MATKGKVPAPQTNVGVRVPRDLYERFGLAAKANHRSLSGEVRHLIEQRVAEFEDAIQEAA